MRHVLPSLIESAGKGWPGVAGCASLHVSRFAKPDLAHGLEWLDVHHCMCRALPSLIWHMAWSGWMCISACVARC